MLPPAPVDTVMAGVLPEADVSFEFEQPAKAMLGVTIRVMRAEILLGSVFGMLTRFPLSSCRRACGGTHDASGRLLRRESTTVTPQRVDRTEPQRHHRCATVSDLHRLRSLWRAPDRVRFEAIAH
ncbi:hypothetical protein E5345_09015 [Propionibacterium sp. NM47_B9-13]|uniref:Uncharacterized protein n=1 Tax=Cutibacterium modestum HL044PA1 TaxID=765109 RepID=A0ABP2K5C5_9ACTN|nr:hypothetical protein BCB70_06100 [Cutibacterium modestum]EFS73063.1 hypothetical protein HMPREF9621_02672 [Cutibacterium modestum HL037PA2]EFS92133.1 hypothetical protein HMPREF9607_01762 [Cutibacterium modestum HL044PA1]EFT14099.1 hypothetical protein HMPREF9622_02866 [Cutibacterium modestum HL037PA3]MCP2375259.1 hypothetical protein [Cutibacterium modestum 28N]TGY28379.1 hypothetical protein E5345_09015 [Propionibacterium sp. NM47_B9-13]